MSIYLDHAAATPMDPRVKQAMDPYFSDCFGNPSSLHSLGRLAKQAIDNARERVANVLNCKANEIIFTGSGTESDNLAIFGIVNQHQGGHIITTNFEHKAVAEPCKELEKRGFEIEYLKVDKQGLISVEQLKSALNEKTILVSIMYANNEIGTVEPIEELSKVLKGIPFHADACQAPGHLSINVKDLGVDLLTINGSKIYGPKGVGLLYVKQGTKIKPIVYGGGQENNLRSGTENVAGIVGLAKALELCQEQDRSTALRDLLIQGILSTIKGSFLNGHPEKRLANNVNISIPNIQGEALLFYLDEYGICASAGSACSAQKDNGAADVMTALYGSRDHKMGTVRFTLGRSTTKEDIEKVLEVLPKIVLKLRKV